MNVVIIQRRLTHYRVPFFEALRAALASRGVALQLLVGVGTADEVRKNDAGTLSWAETVSTRYFLGGRICWQTLGDRLDGADLVVVTQENKLVRNVPLLLARRRGKVALWGHGANLQSKRRDGLRERYKRYLSRQADWWFAYTEMSRQIVAGSGFPVERITVLNNAVDTSRLRRDLASIRTTERRELDETLGLSSPKRALFLGSLYREKRLDFLFAAADLIRAQVPAFELLVVGDGPLRDDVAAWCASRSWAKWVGAKFGREKALHISLTCIHLNPGLVGLGLLDALASGLPTITTQCDLHSPEIDYLVDGINGAITRDDVQAYVAKVVELLEHPHELECMRDACLRTSAHLTVEAMAERFADGVMSACGVGAPVRTQHLDEMPSGEPEPGVRDV